MPKADLILTKKDGEFLRVVASVAVVSAHCIHYWVEQFSQGGTFLSIPFVCTVLDQFTRFTVPLFFFLSGFGLTLQFQERPVPLARYYRFRLVKILAPFLVWSLVTSLRHLDFLAGLPWSDAPHEAARVFLRFLFLDGFDYQYYFLIVIFQFYLVYPFVYKWARSKIWMGAFLILHLFFMSPMETYLQLLGFDGLPKVHPNLLLFHWFYCFAGMYAAWNKNFLVDLLARRSRAEVAGFWIAVFAIMNVEFIINIQNRKFLFDVDHFNRWSVVLYCLASLMLFLKFRAVIAARVYQHPRFRFLFTHVAPYTFFVYLTHTHVLRIVDYLFWEVTVFDLANRVILVVMGTYVLAWFTAWLLEDFPSARFYLGLPKHGAVDWAGVPGLSRLRLRRRRGVGSAEGTKQKRRPLPAAAHEVSDNFN